LIPHWAKDSSAGQNTFNARAETLLDKPSFAEAFQQRRCLIPADGFYEWQRSGKIRQAFHFGMQNDSLFAFAGLWDRWIDPTGQAIESCSILTIAANAIMDGVHHRMPAVLSREIYSTWMDPTLRNTAELAALLKRLEPGPMKRYAVSPRVNSVINDDAECAVPWIPPQATLALEF
jgi:putative SOS response-associated peptidase YedK